MPSKSKTIEERIKSLKPGTVFIPSDFLDVATQQTIMPILFRLEKSGKIKRVVRGVYTLPEYSEYLNKELSVSPDLVVGAIARNNDWIVIPSGDNALNSLGLSTQVPARFEYVSSGPYKQYEYDGIEIVLKHRANRDLVNKSRKSALVIQALKALGKDSTSDKTVEALARALTRREREQLYEDARTSSAWIFEIAKELYEGTTK